MKGGILEVLLVNAKGIRHTHFIGKSSYCIIVECGDKAYKSKASPGHDGKTWWNEKFAFEYPSFKWKKATYLKIKIKESGSLREGGFVGTTTIYLGGIITEGLQCGKIEVKPSPYNVVLEDDTYKGQIVLGLNFTAKSELGMKTRSRTVRLSEPIKPSIFASTLNLWKISWWKILFIRALRKSNK